MTFKKWLNFTVDPDSDVSTSINMTDIGFYTIYCHSAEGATALFLDNAAALCTGVGGVCVLRALLFKIRVLNPWRESTEEGGYDLLTCWSLV